jgi:hypothetical protein
MTTHTAIEQDVKLKKSQQNFISRIFFDHPHAAGETYFTHLAFTAQMALYLFLTAGAIIIHGLMPCFFTTTGSDRVAKLNGIMQARRHRHVHDDTP